VCRAGPHFLTVNGLERCSDLFVRQIDGVRPTRRDRPFAVAARAVLPTQMRCILTLPEGGDHISCAPVLRPSFE